MEVVNGWSDMLQPIFLDVSNSPHGHWSKPQVKMDTILASFVPFILQRPCQTLTSVLKSPLKTLRIVVPKLGGHGFRVRLLVAHTGLHQKVKTVCGLTLYLLSLLFLLRFSSLNRRNIQEGSKLWRRVVGHNTAHILRHFRFSPQPLIKASS